MLTKQNERKEPSNPCDELPEAPLAPRADFGDAEDDTFVTSEAAPSVKEDKCESRLAEIRQMFAGKAMSYFDMAKYAREYYELKKEEIAQNEQKSGPGRPGLLSAMARELKIPAKTDAAKRAWLDRALKVARLSPEAKTAAAHAKLEKNRSALIEIADAGSTVKQLQKIEEIKQRKSDTKKQAKMFVTKVVRFPIGRKDEITAKLIEFADGEGIEVL